MPMKLQWLGILTANLGSCTVKEYLHTNSNNNNFARNNNNILHISSIKVEVVYR
jgi:hypothetical protein